MQIHLHPTRREALTASYKAITRWSLETNPATILTQIVHPPESVRLLWSNSESISPSPDGQLFAHEDPTPNLADPRVVAWRNWDDLSIVRKAVLPNTTLGIFSLASSPDGRWLVIGPWAGRIFLLDWHTGEISSHHAIAGIATGDEDEEVEGDEEI